MCFSWRPARLAPRCPWLFPLFVLRSVYLCIPITCLHARLRQFDALGRPSPPAGRASKGFVNKFTTVVKYFTMAVKYFTDVSVTCWLLMIYDFVKFCEQIFLVRKAACRFAKAYLPACGRRRFAWRNTVFCAA